MVRSRIRIDSLSLSVTRCAFQCRLASKGVYSVSYFILYTCMKSVPLGKLHSRLASSVAATLTTCHIFCQLPSM